MLIFIKLNEEKTVTIKNLKNLMLSYVNKLLNFGLYEEKV